MDKITETPKQTEKNGGSVGVETDVRLHWHDVEELAAHILGLGDEYESGDVENELCDKYEISFESFHAIIEKLLPLVDVGESPLSGKWYRGFSKPINEKMREWLLKVGIT